MKSDVHAQNINMQQWQHFHIDAHIHSHTGPTRREKDASPATTTTIIVEKASQEIDL